MAPRGPIWGFASVDPLRRGRNRATGPAAKHGFDLPAPTKSRASRERDVFDRAQEGGHEGSSVVGTVAEKARGRHASFSLLWYELWYEFHNLLFFRGLLAEREGFEPSMGF